MILSRSATDAFWADPGEPRTGLAGRNGTPWARERVFTGSKPVLVKNGKKIVSKQKVAVWITKIL